MSEQKLDKTVEPFGIKLASEQRGFAQSPLPLLALVGGAFVLVNTISATGTVFDWLVSSETISDGNTEFSVIAVLSGLFAFKTVVGVAFGLAILRRERLNARWWKWRLGWIYLVASAVAGLINLVGLFVYATQQGAWAS